MSKLKVKLLRGLAGESERHIQAVKSLGLKKRGQERILEDNPLVWGNIRKAFHLVGVAYRIDFSGDIPTVERDLSEKPDYTVINKNGVYTNGKGVYYFSRITDLEDFLRKKGYKKYKNWKGEEVEL
ncbi:ribosomal protein L30 [Aquifex aeolicus VF5]|uniref:Large ribosomal subunit protein uL30 n=1 Tax=Aquifex aeolicus (strain VF5) TaxID=224324 RepID=RL30_AQUAE|nr:RecName: Full=Large ribosomal subunit protein uL30; AltName: Full=50S ribosomal protein L30 [Aquifex aeolicus VF5]AAC07535.1 ribosomal protein L30 [Aquifex aeolicus VF5]